MKRSAAPFLLACISLTACALDTSNPLTVKYPFGLLTNDYGILNDTDLALYAKEEYPRPFSVKNLSSLYWQCAPTESVSMSCDDPIFNEDKSCPTAIGALKVEVGNAIHRYLDRRPVCLADCRAEMRYRMALMYRERYVCVGGSVSGLERDSETGRPDYVWTYDKLKTKRGCNSWWRGECDSTSALAELARESSYIP